MTQTSEYQGRMVIVTGGCGGIDGAISEGAGVHVVDLKPSPVIPFAWRQILFVDTP